MKLFVHRFRRQDIPPSGLTVVLLHGYLDCGATWDLVAEHLASAGHDVVAPDLRGFGRSDRISPEAYYHFPDYLADLDELLRQLAPCRLALVGHSMGGTIASMYTGLFPEKVERLALLEGIGPPSMPPDVAVHRMLAWLHGLRMLDRQGKAIGSLEQATERLALNHPRVPIEMLASRARHLTRTDASGRISWAHDPLHWTTSPVPFMVERFQTFLRRIRCPTLFISGGPTGYHPADEADRLACIHDVRVVELAEAGHMMHWSAPRETADSLLHFLGPTQQLGA